MTIALTAGLMGMWSATLLGSGNMITRLRRWAILEQLVGQPGVDLRLHGPVRGGQRLARGVFACTPSFAGVERARFDMPLHVEQPLLLVLSTLRPPSSASACSGCCSPRPSSCGRRRPAPWPTSSSTRCGCSAGCWSRSRSCGRRCGSPRTCSLPPGACRPRSTPPPAATPPAPRPSVAMRVLLSVLYVGVTAVPAEERVRMVGALERHLATAVGNVRIFFVAGWRTNLALFQWLTPAALLATTVIGVPACQLIWFVHLGRYLGTHSVSYYAVGNAVHAWPWPDCSPRPSPSPASAAWTRSTPCWPRRPTGR